MLSVKQWCSEVSSRPLELIIGLCIFATAAAGGAVDSIASISLGILFLISLFYIRYWRQTWQDLSSGERLILVSFAVYFLSAVPSYYNVTDEHEFVKHLGRYLRFMLIIPVYLLISRSDFKLFKYLFAGALVSGPLYFTIALASVAESPGQPASGGYHHVVFGDMAMLGALLLATVLLVRKTSVTMKVVLVISTLCLLYSSILSTARGAWIALPFCLLLLPLAFRFNKSRVRLILVTFLVLGAVLFMTPAKDILSSRVQKAVDEVEAFRTGNQYGTSVGLRLAMWDIATDVWKKHPIIGTGLGDFDLEMQARGEGDEYERIWVQSSAHSNYFQALATTGTIGVLTLFMALIILPFRYFYRLNKQSVDVVALSGMVTITAFTVFGLTASWILRSPLVAMFLIYFVVLATEAAKISRGNNEPDSEKTA